MALIQCPECGCKISDHALVCPHCGYVGDDPKKPISQQAKYEMVPTFKFSIEDYKDENSFEVMSPEDNETLVSYFGDWAILTTKFPDIALSIKGLMERETVAVADVSKYTKQLIDEGIYRFTIAKDGRILPTIRDSKGIVQQVRLKEVDLAPELSQSLNNLTIQMGQMQIMAQIKSLGETLQRIEHGIQNDRIAMAEASMDKLHQASKVTDDLQLRRDMLLEAVTSATDAKRTLMRNFHQNISYLKYHRGDHTSLGNRMMGNDPYSDAANYAIEDLIAITRAVQVEQVGYDMLNEHPVAIECLGQFDKFILDNKLDKRDTLLLVNEYLPNSQKNGKIVSDFSKLTHQISVNIDQFRIEASEAQKKLSQMELKEDEKENSSDEKKN